MGPCLETTTRNPTKGAQNDGEKPYKIQQIARAPRHVKNWYTPPARALEQDKASSAGLSSEGSCQQVGAPVVYTSSLTDTGANRHVSERDYRQ